MLQPPDSQRAYTLFKLLSNKYGRGREDFGLSILAQWVAPLNKSSYKTTVLYLEQLTDTSYLGIGVTSIPPEIAEELRKYFGLTSIDELINYDVL